MEEYVSLRAIAALRKPSGGRCDRGPLLKPCRRPSRLRNAAAASTEIEAAT